MPNMKAVIETSTGIALYIFPDAEAVTITESGMEAESFSATDIRSSTHSIVENVPRPTFWFGSALIWNDGWVYSESNAGLEFRKERMKDSVTQLRISKSNAGYDHDFGTLHGVKTLQTRDTDLPNWLALTQIANIQISVGRGNEPLRSIRTADNTNIPVTANEALTVMLGMQNHLGAILTKSWELKDLIELAEDHTTLDSIDIYTGW